MGLLLCCFGNKKDNFSQLANNENRALLRSTTGVPSWSSSTYNTQSLSRSTYSAQPLSRSTYSAQPLSRSTYRAQSSGSTYSTQSKVTYGVESGQKVPTSQQSFVCNTRSQNDTSVISQQPSFRTNHSHETSTCQQTTHNRTIWRDPRKISANKLDVHSGTRIKHQSFDTKSNQQSGSQQQLLSTRSNQLPYGTTSGYGSVLCEPSRNLQQHNHSSKREITSRTTPSNQRLPLTIQQHRITEISMRQESYANYQHEFTARQQLTANKTSLQSFNTGFSHQPSTINSNQQSLTMRGYQLEYDSTEIGRQYDSKTQVNSTSQQTSVNKNYQPQSFIKGCSVPTRQISYQTRRYFDDDDDDYYDDTIWTSSYVESKKLCDILNNNFVPSDWSPMLPNENLKFEVLSSNSSEFSVVYNMFKQTTKNKNLNITKIERVQNPYLWGCYKLKKEEMENRYASVNARVQEMRLFHGTRKAHIRSICAGNMDWRKCGSSIGNRYGQGVSFSPIAFYSSHYTDKHTFEENAMLLCKVLVAKEIRGHGDMVLPPVNLSTGFNCDTSIKQDRQVYVKYSDHEFYPEYVIYYTTY